MTLFAGTCGAGVLRLFVCRGLGRAGLLRLLRLFDCRGLGRAALLRLFDFVESYEELGYYLNVYRDLGGAGIFVSICLLIVFSLRYLGCVYCFLLAWTNALTQIKFAWPYVRLSINICTRIIICVATIFFQLCILGPAGNAVSIRYFCC